MICPTDLCRTGDQKFILKEVSPTTFEYFQGLYPKLNGCPYVHLLHDTVPDQSIFVYTHAREHLLNLVKKDLPIVATKRILRDTLRGIAALHDQQILHAGEWACHSAYISTMYNGENA